MSTALVHVPNASESFPSYSRFDELRRAVLNGVAAEHSKRNYALALDELSAYCRERQEPVSQTPHLATAYCQIAENTWLNDLCAIRV